MTSINTSFGNPSLLTIQQVAKILNVHPDTLRRWEKQGKLQSIRVGSRRDRRYKIEDIHQLMNYPATISTPHEIDTKTDNTILKDSFRRAEWIFFDVGYTLLSLFPSRGSFYADIAYEYGYNLKPSVIQENFEKLEKEWEREKILSQPLVNVSQETVIQHYSRFNAEVLMLSGLSRNAQADAVKIGRKIFNSTFSTVMLWKELPGAREFLSLLKQHHKKLAIIENWDIRLEKLIKELKLDHFFEFIIAGGTMNLRKPDSKIFEIAIDRAHTKPSSSIHIGDRYVEDVLGPKQFNMMPVLFDFQRKYLDKDCLSFYKYEEIIKLFS